jgi:hypothetical protein
MLESKRIVGQIEIMMNPLDPVGALMKFAGESPVTFPSSYITWDLDYPLGHAYWHHGLHRDWIVNIMSGPIFWERLLIDQDIQQQSVSSFKLVRFRGTIHYKPDFHFDLERFLLFNA